MLRVPHLPDDPEPVSLVAGLDVGIERQGRLELSNGELAFDPEHLDPLPEDIERAALIDRLPQPIEERLGGMGAMILDERLPGLGLSPLDPGEDVIGKQRPSPVVAARIPFDVDPAVGAQVLADFLLEGEFFVDAHGEEGFMLSRDTAKEIPRPSRRRQQRHRVRGNIRITGCDRESVLDRLRDQQSIEWIAVERRERC